MTADGLTPLVRASSDPRTRADPRTLARPAGYLRGGAAGPPVPRDPSAAGRAARTGQADPASALLDRIAEVCEARYDRGRIRRVAIDPPHLLVTYREDGFVRQLRIGAHVGEPTPADIDAFVRHDARRRRRPRLRAGLRGPAPRGAARGGAAARACGCAASPSSRACSTCATTSPARPPGCAPTGATRRASTCRSASGSWTGPTSEVRDGPGRRDAATCWPPTTGGSCWCSATSAAARRSRCGRWPGGSPTEPRTSSRS